jgi:hypothetical protein
VGLFCKVQYLNNCSFRYHSQGCVQWWLRILFDSQDIQVESSLALMSFSKWQANTCNSGCVTWAFLNRRPVGLINLSYFGGFLVNPSSTNVTLVTILFHSFCLCDSRQDLGITTLPFSFQFWWLWTSRLLQFL